MYDMIHDLHKNWISLPKNVLSTCMYITGKLLTVYFTWLLLGGGVAHGVPALVHQQLHPALQRHTRQDHAEQIRQTGGWADMTGRKGCGLQWTSTDAIIEIQMQLK